MSIRRGIGHRMISEQFISKIKRLSKGAPDNCQMVTDLISLGNRIGTTRRWPQMTKC
jgi:hypothetical protein